MSSDTVAGHRRGTRWAACRAGVAEIGGKAVLIEQREFLGGIPVAENYSGLTPRGEPAQPQIRQMIDLVTANPLAEIRLGTEVAGVAGEPGAFTLTLRQRSQRREPGGRVGAGGRGHCRVRRHHHRHRVRPFRPRPVDPDVRVLRVPRRHHPAGARGRCCPSTGCCGPPTASRRSGSASSSAWAAATARSATSTARRCAAAWRRRRPSRSGELLPDSKVLIFYIDMRMYGYWENEIYWPAQEQHHVQYVKGLITEVLPKGDRLLVRGEDTTMGRPMEVLDGPGRAVGRHGAVAGHPPGRGAARRQGRTSTASSTPSARRSTRSAPTGRAIFACGAALGPADLEDTVSSAAGAAVKAVGYLRSRAGSPAAS